MSSPSDLVPPRHFVPSAPLGDPDSVVDDPRSSTDLDRSGDVADPLLEDFLADLSGPNAFAPLSRAPTTPQVPGSDGPAGIAAIATLSGQRALAGDRVVAHHSPDPPSPRGASVLSERFSESSAPPPAPSAQRFDALRRPSSPAPSELSSVVDADIEIPSPDDPPAADALSDFERLLHAAELSEDDSADLVSAPSGAGADSSGEAPVPCVSFAGPPEPDAPVSEAPEPDAPVCGAPPPPASGVAPAPSPPAAPAAPDLDAPSPRSLGDPFPPFHPASGPVVEFDPHSLVADADLPDVAPGGEDSVSDPGLAAYFDELADDAASGGAAPSSDPADPTAGLALAGPVSDPVYDAPPAGGDADAPPPVASPGPALPAPSLEPAPDPVPDSSFPVPPSVSEPRVGASLPGDVADVPLGRAPPAPSSGGPAGSAPGPGALAASSPPSEIRDLASGPVDAGGAPGRAPSRRLFRSRLPRRGPSGAPLLRVRTRLFRRCRSAGSGTPGRRRPFGSRRPRPRDSRAFGARSPSAPCRLRPPLPGPAPAPPSPCVARAGAPPPASSPAASGSSVAEPPAGVSEAPAVDPPVPGPPAPVSPAPPGVPSGAGPARPSFVVDPWCSSTMSPSSRCSLRCRTPPPFPPICSRSTLRVSMPVWDAGSPSLSTAPPLPPRSPRSRSFARSARSSRSGSPSTWSRVTVPAMTIGRTRCAPSSTTTSSAACG